MGPGARGRDAASSTQGQRSPEAVHSGVPRGSGPPKADVSAHQAFLPVSSGLLLGQQGAGWQGGWWGHSQPQAAPGSGRGATGVGGGGTWPGQGRPPARVPQDQPPPRSTLFFQASPPFSFSHCREPPGTFQGPSHTRGLSWVSAKAGFCFWQDLIRRTSGWSQTWMGPLSLGLVTAAGTGEAGSLHAEGQSWPQDPQGAAPSRD